MSVKRTGSTSVALAIGLLALLLSAAPASADGGDYYSRINSLRAQRGLAPLQVDGNLAAGAQSWAQTMANQGTIFHSDLNSWMPAGATNIAENVGMGPDSGMVFNAFVNSPPHLANLLNPAFTHVGVGVVTVGGQQFTAHRFAAMSGAPAPTTPPAPAPTAPPAPAPTTPAPVVTAPPTTSAPPTTAPAPAPDPEPQPVPTPADPERVTVVLTAIRAIG